MMTYTVATECLVEFVAIDLLTNIGICNSVTKQEIHWVVMGRHQRGTK